MMFGSILEKYLFDHRYNYLKTKVGIHDKRGYILNKYFWNWPFLKVKCNYISDSNKNEMKFEVIINDIFTNVTLDNSLAPIDKKSVLGILNDFENGSYRAKS